METIVERVESKLEEFMLPQLQMSIGLWIDGHTYWLHNQNEKIITKEKLTVKIKQEYMHSKVRNSYIYITNHNEFQKKIKLLIMHRYVRASKDHLAFISPSEQVIFHLANKKVFLVNGEYEGQTIQQATIQPFWNMNTDQMWSCSNSGHLKYQPMAKGFAVSMFTLDIEIPLHETIKASTWAILGEGKNELLQVNNRLLKKHTSISF